MPIYIVTGEVFPRDGECTLRVPPTFAAYDELDVTVIFELVLEKSVFTLSVDVTGTLDIGSLRNFAEQFVRSRLDLWNFFYGAGYDIALTKAVTEEGEEIPFHVFRSAVHQLNLPRAITGDELVQIFISNSNNDQRLISIALGSLSMIIRSHTLLDFHCWKAIESIRRIFDPNESKGEKLMSEALNIHRYAVFKYFRERTGEVRHGGVPKFRTAEEAVTMMKLAYEVVNRYFAYVKGGKVPLDPKVFPELLPILEKMLLGTTSSVSK